MNATNESAVDPPAESYRLQRAAVFGLVIIALVGVLLFAWSTILARRQIAEATRALDSGRIDVAEALVGRYVYDHPGSAQAEFLSARLAWAQKRPDDVLRHLGRARALGFDQAPMQRLLGLLYAASGRRDEAEPLLHEAWGSTTSPDWEVADALCRLDFEAYRLRPALAVADEWARRSPGDIRPLLWRAEIHTRDNVAVEEQIRAYDAILERDPGQLPARLGRATAYRQVGRLDDARRDYATYLEARPDDPQGHIGAARTAEGLDDEDAALAHYERLLRIDPRNVVGLLGKGSILLRRNKPAEALPLLERAIAREPNDPESHYRRGQALDRLGRRDEARDEFANQARLQNEQREIEEIRKGIVRNPDDIELLASAARWLLGHGYESEGLAWADKTLAKSPRHVATLRLLADHFERKKDVGRANFYRLQVPNSSRDKADSKSRAGGP